MKNQRIEAGLSRAIGEITPDVYSKVATAPIKKMVAHDHITAPSITPAKTSYRLQLATAFAVFAVVIGVFIGWTQFFQTFGIVDLDVNPSIELSINRQNRVISAKALNLDGVQILSGMNLKYSKLENAIDAILGSMISNGYLTSPDDAMLVTVLMEEEVKAEQLENTVILRVNQFFPPDSTPVVYTQSLRDTQEIKSKAGEYQISRGVMNLIEIIQQEYPDYTIDQLVEMPVRQLYELAYRDDDEQDRRDDLDEQDGDGEFDELYDDNQDELDEDENGELDDQEDLDMDDDVDETDDTSGDDSVDGDNNEIGDDDFDDTSDDNGDNNDDDEVENNDDIDDDD